MKRVYHVRMTIETNDPDDTAGDPYYTDHEIPRMITEWFEQALSDRMDHPKIVWSEWTWDDGKPPLPVADTGEINVIRGRE